MDGSRSSSPLTQLLLALLALGVWGVLLKPYLPSASAAAEPFSGGRSAVFDTLTVQRLNVVDPDGRTRLVIANIKRFPGAVIRGKAYAPSIHDSAGMLFYNAKGDEIGGLALTKLGSDNVANLTLDYAYQTTDGIYMIRRESQDGKHWQAGFGISDRRPYRAGPVESSQGVQRIALTDKDRNAQLIISDAQGRPRIRIGVDGSGKPQIEMIDVAGRAVYRARESTRSKG